MRNGRSATDRVKTMNLRAGMGRTDRRSCRYRLRSYALEGARVFQHLLLPGAHEMIVRWNDPGPHEVVHVKDLNT